MYVLTFFFRRVFPRGEAAAKEAKSDTERIQGLDTLSPQMIRSDIVERLRTS